jgi:putative ABC transport system substrate-binding protein
VIRRDFITLLGGAATWPLTARAQQADKALRVGFFGNSLNSPPAIIYYEAFLARLRELGFTEGQNLVAEYRGLNDPRGAFVSAAELMRFAPNVIVAAGPEIALQAVIGASVSVPIILVAVNFDPVERGYVASLARPGGNITGVVFRQIELAAKQVEVFHQAFPDRDRMAVLWDALTADQFSAAERMAQTLRLEVRTLKLENPPYDFETAFRSAAVAGSQMMLVLSSPFFTEHRNRIAELAIEHGLPTMFAFRHYVEVGGLLSYGADFPPMYRRAADYAAKVFKGEKAAELPIEQATKFETVLNLKTARAIGVELPTSILLRADEVIE